MTNTSDPVPDWETQLEVFETQISGREAIEREFAFIDEYSKGVSVIGAAEWEAREVLALEPGRVLGRKRVLLKMRFLFVFWVSALLFAAVAIIFTFENGSTFSWPAFVAGQLLWLVVVFSAVKFFEAYFTLGDRKTVHK